MEPDGTKLKNEFVEAERERLAGRQASPGRSSSAPRPAEAEASRASSFMRRALAGAGTVASRLGAIGRAVRTGIPILSAVSTIIHAIVEAHDAEKAKFVPNDRRADLAPARPSPAHKPGGPRMG
jgi:hypothetical protein